MPDPKRAGYLHELAAMLRRVFGGDRYTTSYLAWQYDANPDGVEIATDLYKDDKLAAHYTVIPQSYWLHSQPQLLSLSLNTAVTEAARGKGVFTGLAEDTYAKAAAAGVQAVLGVANANSTPGFLGRLKFHHIASLPAIVGACLPWRARGITSRMVDAAYLASPAFAALAADVVISLRASPHGRQNWDAARLGWRLASPHSRYALHIHADALLVTTTEKRAGLPFTCLLKFLSLHGLTEISPTTTRALVRAAALFHRAPLFVYAGFNDAMRLTGLSLPQRLRPSPLNLIYRSLNGDAAEQPQLASFEFLDFDAY